MKTNSAEILTPQEIAEFANEIEHSESPAFLRLISRRLLVTLRERERERDLLQYTVRAHERNLLEHSQLVNERGEENKLLLSDNERLKLTIAGKTFPVEDCPGCKRLREEIEQHKRAFLEVVKAIGEAVRNAQRLRDALEPPYALLAEAERELIEIRQLIGGWKITTPPNEWSEWDEAVAKGAESIHGKIYKALADRVEQAHKGV